MFSFPLTRKRETYRMKMDSYTQQVFEFEETLPVQQQLIAAEKRLAELEKQSRYKLLGNHHLYKEMFYLMTHSTHFVYGYMASDTW